VPAGLARRRTDAHLHTETTLPVNVFTETAIKGDLIADGRLVITEAQAKDQFWAMWGVQSRYYSSLGRRRPVLRG
jgi:hypothetical protein